MPYRIDHKIARVVEVVCLTLNLSLEEGDAVFTFKPFVVMAVMQLRRGIGSLLLNRLVAALLLLQDKCVVSVLVHPMRCSWGQDNLRDFHTWCVTRALLGITAMLLFMHQPERNNVQFQRLNCIIAMGL